MRKKTLGEPLGIREHEIGFSFISEGSSPHNVNSVQFKFQPRRAVRRLRCLLSPRKTFSRTSFMRP